MLYLNKFLNEIKKSPLLLKSPNIILVLGITSTHIKKLKKHALENQLITQSKQEYFLTKLVHMVYGVKCCLKNLKLHIMM